MEQRPWKKSDHALRHIRDRKPLSLGSGSFVRKRDGTKQRGALIDAAARRLRGSTPIQGPNRARKGSSSRGQMAMPNRPDVKTELRRSPWSPEEDTLIIELRRGGMNWEDMSMRLPGRSALSCQLRYQQYLERRSETSLKGAPVAPVGDVPTSVPPPSTSSLFPPSSPEPESDTDMLIRCGESTCNRTFSGRSNWLRHLRDAHGFNQMYKAAVASPQNATDVVSRIPGWVIGTPPNREDGPPTKVRTGDESPKDPPPDLHNKSHSPDNHKPLFADDFGTFSYKSLPVLESANRELIQRLRANAAQMADDGVHAQVKKVQPQLRRELFSDGDTDTSYSESDMYDDDKPQVPAADKPRLFIKRTISEDLSEGLEADRLAKLRVNMSAKRRLSSESRWRETSSLKLRRSDSNRRE